MAEPLGPSLVAHRALDRLGGLAAGVVLVLFSARILALLQVPLLAPDPRYVVTAALLLTLTALAGLCAPLWRLGRLDILRTLQPN
jgi:ABC-type antimicrobial peptide transport system permease subunit